MFAERILVVLAVCGVVLGMGLNLNAGEPAIETSQQQVGPTKENGAITPVNQRITPFGQVIELPGMRPQAMAMSPDGQVLIVAGKTNDLVVLSAETGVVRQRVALPGEPRIDPANDDPDQVSFTGLVFSPDGQRIFLSNVNGSIKVFSVKEGAIYASHVMAIPAANAPRRKPEIPSGLALSADGARLYISGNLSNQLLEMDTTTGVILRRFDVGVAPYDVVLSHGKAFVSNWGGPRPGPNDLRGPAGRGTEVRVDPIRHIASEGSVSIIDLDGQEATIELTTGLHACALAISPDDRYVVCANAGSDHLSIIEIASSSVKETVWVKSKPSDLFGASPNALAFDASGKTLFVANGTQNAVAVVNFKPEDKGESRLTGLIPTGWFPGALVFDAKRNRINCANIKGLPMSPRKQEKTGASGYNSHHYHGSVSMMPVPDKDELARLSELAARNLRRSAIEHAALPPRPHQPPRAIPERIGEPSSIKHVVYVIKENRTYDQVFGKLPQGNGHPDLCIFGEEVTPNQHKMVRDFVLLDNTYCCGILSADGHQWCTTGLVTDYLEKSFANFPRSYPDGQGIDEADAIAYSPAGFIWDNALAHGKTIRNYGEFMIPQVRWRDKIQTGPITFMACYRTWKGVSNEILFDCAPAVESIRPFSPPHCVGWEMALLDQYRADMFLKELADFEARGTFPDLVFICLPQDHTSGTTPGNPTPASCVADNDRAFGRIVEGLSRSQFWKETVIFAIEDDPQDGWDHVCGYRTTAYCIGPYVKRNQVISTQYNTTSILRTIEQILGLPCMNQFDASATPMFDCFTDTPDLRPFESLPSQIPFDQMNPDVADIVDPVLRQDAIVSSTLNFREVDKAPEDVLNRILWRAQKGTAIPYPEWATSGHTDDDDSEHGDSDDNADED